MTDLIGGGEEERRRKTLDFYFSDIINGISSSTILQRKKWKGANMRQT